MWTCPKCGREFKRTNQSHYCGKAPESVDEYIELQIPEARAYVVELRNLYKKDKFSISFAACNKHISLYVDTNVLEIFKSQLSAFTIRKNAVYLPYEKELPIKIIEKIIKQSLEEIT